MPGSFDAAINLMLRQLLQRITETERRTAGQEIRGKVTDVDPAKARARIEIGKDEDGASVKSPWLPYKQVAGALKFHQPPSVGETMTMRSASGDIEQGVLESFHWSDANEAPSTDGAKNVMTFGDVTVTIEGGAILASIGGTTFRFSADGLHQEGGDQTHNGGMQKHNGVNVGSSHVHSQGSDSHGDGEVDTDPPH